jgi:hypothetical protein
MRLALAVLAAVAAAWFALWGVDLILAAPDHRDTNLYPFGLLGVGLAVLCLAVSAALLRSVRSRRTPTRDRL